MPALLVFGTLVFTACDDEPEPTTDPLDDAQVVRCDMPLDGACREYRRVRNGDFESFVNVSEARSFCDAGWPNGTGDAGVFEAGECSTAAALARCRVDVGYIAVDYFYEGFADTETLEDPLAPLHETCSTLGGTLEQPPFP